MSPKRKQQIANQTIFTGDNLDIMRGMDSESVDLIYLDPPFNSNRHYEAPIGSKAAGAEFKDAWTFEDTKEAWWGLIADEHPAIYKVIDAAGDVGSKGDKAYLIYMAMRLLEMHRILKTSGSIFLHCDPTMSHSLKMVMDAIFGRKNFRNEIIWQRAAGKAKGSQYEKRTFGVDNDCIFYFAKNSSHKPAQPFRELTEEEEQIKFPKIDENGRRYNTDVPIFCSPTMGSRPNLCYTYKNVTNPHPSGWRVSKERLIEMDKEGIIIWRGSKTPLRKSYADEYKGQPFTSLWTDILPPPKKERTGYPTQKPLALLERIIKAASYEGDLVLDPFCGCATACIAAERLSRQWIGIDISSKAADLVKTRAVEELSDLFNKQSNRLFNVKHETHVPTRSDQRGRPSKDIHHTLFGKQEGKCNGCGHSFPFQNFTRDHIIPTARGGANTDDNLQLLCGHCNSIKGDRTMEYLVGKLTNDGILKKPRGRK